MPSMVGVAQWLLLCASACMANAVIDVQASTGAIAVPEHLKPLHRRARSTQRLAEAQWQPWNGNDLRAVVRRSIDDIKTVTDKIVHKSVTLGTMRAKYVTIEWVGNSDSGVTDAIIVITDRDGTKNTVTELYRSVDNGLSFVDETAKVNRETVNSESLLKNTYFPERVLMYTITKDKLWTSKDAGNSWQSVPLKLDIAVDRIFFHPSEPDWFIALSGAANEVHLTKDFGATFTATLGKGAVTIDWGVPAIHGRETVFWTQKRSDGKANEFDLYRTKDLFQSAQKIQENGFDFALINEYLFISKLNADGKTMELRVSQDGGDVWNHAHFPVNLQQTELKQQERAELGYQILDASEGSVFINVDNDNGLGTAGGAHTGNLYTSDKSGTSYSLSLQNHLFLQNVRNDFHKVKSLVGTYITNQLVEDNHAQEFRSVITFDKGAIWKPINPPTKDARGEDIECDDCYLQLHNYVSEETMSIQPIFSLETAAGLVIAHGTVDRYLSTTRRTNLYLSRDGGFAWEEILEGMWTFDVADHGGLIVAVPVGKGFQNTVYFTWDYGTTWNKFQFQEQPIAVVKVLSKPGSATRVFNLWGNTQEGTWHIVSMDFTDFLGRPCTSEDYTSWSPSDGRVSKEKCVLGHKRVYKRRKVKSLCYNDVHYELQSDNITCPCTKEDFECDYGFYKPSIDSHCVEFPDFNLTQQAVCKDGRQKYYVSSGYRKIAGDLCTGGVENQYLEGKQLPCPGHSKVPVVAIVVPTVVALIALVGIALTAWVYNRKKNYWRARYLSLAQMDHDDEIPHTGLDSDSEEDSDEELEIAQPKSRHNTSPPTPGPRANGNSASAASKDTRAIAKSLFDNANLDDETELEDL